MAKAKATSESIESGFETPSLEPLPPPPEFGGQEFSTRLPFVHPELGQVIQGRIIRKVTRPDRFNKDREKQILILELLAEFDNAGGGSGATKQPPSRMYIGEQVQFDVRAGYGALFDLAVGDEIQLTNLGQTIDTGKGNLGWDWAIKSRPASR